MNDRKVDKKPSLDFWKRTKKTWKSEILRDLGKMTEQVIEWVNPYFKTVKIRGEKETKRKKICVIDFMKKRLNENGHGK